MDAIWLFLLNIYPDMLKGMMKGIIMALGIPHKIIFVHILCHWIIFPTGIWYFAFRQKRGVFGIWMAKIILEWSILTLYIIMIKLQDLLH